MNNLKLILVLLFTSIILNANEYSELVNNFLKYQNSTKQVENIVVLKKDDKEVGYIYNLTNGGYIVSYPFLFI